MIATDIDGEWYHVLYHPHIINFIIIKAKNQNYHMVKDKNGKWLCLKPNILQNFLPAEELYTSTREAISGSKISSKVIVQHDSCNHYDK